MISRVNIIWVALRFSQKDSSFCENRDFSFINPHLLVEYPETGYFL